MYHNLMMIKFTALVCATVLIFGCAEDKDISPAFPEIKNPLDDSNEKQNALDLATEVDVDGEGTIFLPKLNDPNNWFPSLDPVSIFDPDFLSISFSNIPIPINPSIKFSLFNDFVL